uniref:CSON003573 protein n=1 Tax=Culicoides sonorensis TaxID=179676 RepID=A0A336MNS9_CULSO
MKINILKLLVTLVIIKCTEALYIHKILDQNEITPKPVELCRKSCFKKFISEKTFTPENMNKCSSDSSCFMCWDYCGYLLNESRIVTVSMCTDFVCYSGCKFACKYYAMTHKDATKQEKGTSFDDQLNHDGTKVLSNSVHLKDPSIEAKLL